MHEFAMEHPWMTFCLVLSPIWGGQRIWISTAAVLTNGRVTFCDHECEDKDGKAS